GGRPIGPSGFGSLLRASPRFGSLSKAPLSFNSWDVLRMRPIVLPAHSMTKAAFRGGFTRVAGLAEGLDVGVDGPEEHHVALVGDDVIGLGRRHEDFAVDVERIDAERVSC